MRVNLIQNFANRNIAVFHNAAVNAKKQSSNENKQKEIRVMELPGAAYFPVFGAGQVETLIFDLKTKKGYSYKTKGDAIKVLQRFGPIDHNSVNNGKLVNNRYFIVRAENVKNSNGKVDNKKLSEALKCARERAEQQKAPIGTFYMINEDDVMKCSTAEEGAKLTDLEKGNFTNRMHQQAKIIGNYAVLTEAELLDENGKIDENKVAKARELLKAKKQRKASVIMPVYVLQRGREPERFDSKNKAALELDVSVITVGGAIENGTLIRKNAMVIPAAKLEDEDGNPIPEKIKEAQEKFAAMMRQH